jgi:hypothetical protein
LRAWQLEEDWYYYCSTVQDYFLPEVTFSCAVAGAARRDQELTLFE